MFHAGNWAAAFISLFGTNAEAELERLKAIPPVLKPISKNLFGRTAARRLEKLLRENTGAEFKNVINFIALAVTKNCYRNIDSIIAETEKRLDERGGILDITMESAEEAGRPVTDELEKMIRQQTGAAGIRIQTKLNPELLSGCRLRMGGLCIDASLRGQLEKMTNYLSDSRPADTGTALTRRAQEY